MYRDKKIFLSYAALDETYKGVNTKSYLNHVPEWDGCFQSHSMDFSNILERHRKHVCLRISKYSILLNIAFHIYKDSSSNYIWAECGGKIPTNASFLSENILNFSLESSPTCLGHSSMRYACINDQYYPI